MIGSGFDFDGPVAIANGLGATGGRTVAGVGTDLPGPVAADNGDGDDVVSDETGAGVAAVVPEGFKAVALAVEDVLGADVVDVSFPVVPGEAADESRITEAGNEAVISEGVAGFANAVTTGAGVAELAVEGVDIDLGGADEDDATDAVVWDVAGNGIDLAVRGPILKFLDASASSELIDLCCGRRLHDTSES